MALHAKVDGLIVADRPPRTWRCAAKSQLAAIELALDGFEGAAIASADRGAEVKRSLKRGSGDGILGRKSLEAALIDEVVEIILPAEEGIRPLIDDAGVGRGDHWSEEAAGYSLIAPGCCVRARSGPAKLESSAS